jgi:hypothetical protein
LAISFSTYSIVFLTAKSQEAEGQPSLGATDSQANQTTSGDQNVAKKQDLGFLILCNLLSIRSLGFSLGHFLFHILHCLLDKLLDVAKNQESEGQPKGGPTNDKGVQTVDGRKSAKSQDSLVLPWAVPRIPDSLQPSVHPKFGILSWPFPFPVEKEMAKRESQTSDGQKVAKNQESEGQPKGGPTLRLSLRFLLLRNILVTRSSLVCLAVCCSQAGLS